MSDRILTLLVRSSVGAGVAAAAALCLGLASAPVSAAPEGFYAEGSQWSAAPAIVDEDGAGLARQAGWDEGRRGGWDRGDGNRGWDRDRDEGRGWGHPHRGWGYPRYAEGWGRHRWGPPCRIELQRQWTGWGWTERPVRRCW